MQNRRQHKRYQVDVIEINGKIVLAKYVKILDISISGVCLKTEKRLNIGGEYTLKMEGRGKVLTVRGTVTWALLIGSSVDSHGDIIPVCKAGMKFVDVSNEKINEKHEICTCIRTGLRKSGSAFLSLYSAYDSRKKT